MPTQSITPIAILTYCLTLMVTCILAYGGLVDQPWSYDDLEHIESARRSLQDWSEIAAPTAKEPTRWVLNLYFRCAYWAFGDEPGRYHTANIVLHLVNSLLCANLLLQLFHRPLLAGLAGFLFALNCAPYEAIYEISAAGLLIGTAFSIQSVSLAHRGMETGSRRTILSGAGCFGLALFSYESLVSVILPIAYLWWSRKRRESLFLPISYLTMVAGFLLIDSLYYGTVTGKIGFNAIELGVHAGYNLLFFVGRLFLNAYFTPFGWDSPAPFDVPVEAFDTYAFIGFLLIGFLIYRSLYSRIFKFSTIWIIPALLPYLFGTMDFYFPRYWYLASVGSSLLYSNALLWLYQIVGRKAIAQILVAASLLILGWSSFRKIQHYEGRFLTHAANFHIDHLGDALHAIQLFERARNAYGLHLPLLYQNLAAAYLKAGDLDKALNRVQFVLRNRPDYSNAYRLEGLIWYLKEEYPKAIQYYRQAASIDADRLTELHLLGDQILKRGLPMVALTAYREVLALDPNYENASTCLLNMARILHMTGKPIEAAQALSRAFEGDSSVDNLSQSDLSTALSTYQQILRAFPENENAHHWFLNIAKILHRLGRPVEAAETLSLVLQMKPDFEDAVQYLNLLNPSPE